MTEGGFTVTNCAQCELSFKIKAAKVKERNFCSHACYWESKKRLVIVKCLCCGSDIERKPFNLSKGDQQFCNRKCLFEYRTGKNHYRYKNIENRNCLKCNKQLSHRKSTRERIKFCSIKCGKSGEFHPSWKGGVSPYSSVFEKKIRYEIRQRDWFKCISCGTKRSGKKDLHVHHVDCNKSNNDPDNLITLCAKCHRREHSFIGMKIEGKEARKGG